MPSIRTFSGGVLNPELQNTDSGAGVLYDCKNVLSSWNGELRKRTGTKFLHNLSGPTVLIPFSVQNNDVLFEFSDKKIKAYTFAVDEKIEPFYVGSGVRPQFPTNWTGNTNGEWTVGGSFNTTAFYTAVNGTGLSLPNSDWTAGAEKYFMIKSEEAHVIQSLKFETNSTQDAFLIAPYLYFGRAVLQYSDDGTEWFAVETVESDIEKYSSATLSLKKSRVFTSYVYKITNPRYTVAHKYWRVAVVPKTTDKSTQNYIRALSIKLRDIEYAYNSLEPFEAETEITDSDLGALKYAQVDNSLFVVVGGRKPLRLEYKTGAITVADFIPANSANIWEHNGYPACVASYAGRLWFGGFDNFPLRVIASAFEDIESFTIPTSGIKATDPISIDARQGKYKIENFFGGEKALYVLSEDGVAMIDAPNGSIVSTDMIEMQLRNREPASAMTPTVKDDIMIYCGRDGRKLLTTDYDFIVQRFRANNISLNYNYFLQSGVKSLYYISRKTGLLYGLLNNGKWFALLFGAENNGKNALFPFETNGIVYDIAQIKHNDATRLMLVVQRDGQYVLEEKRETLDNKIMDFMNDAQKSAYTKEVMSSGAYIDSAEEIKLDAPATVIQTPRFRRETEIEVVADGVYLGHKTVSDVVVSPLFAWQYGTEIVYTRSDTPEIGDGVYNESYVPFQEYEIVSATSEKISVKRPASGTQYYGMRSILSVVGADGITYNRNASNDGYRNNRLGTPVYGYGFGSYFTFKPLPANGDYLYEGAWGRVVQIATSQDSVFYTKDATPIVGSKVYNRELAEVGTITEVGTTPTGLDYYVFNGVQYYSAESENFVDGALEKTDEFLRTAGEDKTYTSLGITLDEPAQELILGYSYDSYAVIKFVSPYNLRKFPKEISVNFINTGYLEMGNTFDSLKPCLNNLVKNIKLDTEPILVNGNYTKTFDKNCFETPYIIVRSDYALPFMITGMDYKVDYSNYQGGA